MVDSHGSPPTRPSRRRAGICTGVHIPSSGGPTVPRRRVRVAFRSRPPETPYEWQPHSAAGNKTRKIRFAETVDSKRLAVVYCLVSPVDACGIRRNPWPCYPESFSRYPASEADLGRPGFGLIFVRPKKGGTNRSAIASYSPQQEGVPLAVATEDHS
jgi:hypothetical protein